MKKKIFLIVLILLFVVPTGVIFAKYALEKPLGPPLELDIPPQLAKKSTSTDPSSSKQLFCGNSGVMRILEIGIASPLEQGHQGADAIRLVVVNFDEVTAGILAIPADLWVDTPEDLVDELGIMAPLNQIYLPAYQNATGNPDHVLTQKATQILAQTIVDAFEFVPDKYITINGDAFIDLVDTLDGVTITLDEAIDASGEHFGFFPEGEQTLDGQQTLDFVRILSPNGVGPDYFGRFERQNMIIHGIMDAVLDTENWENIPDLVKEARKMVVTDLSVDQANDLACMVEEVDGDATMLFVDSEAVIVDAYGRMFPDTVLVSDLLAELEGE